MPTACQTWERESVHTNRLSKSWFNIFQMFSSNVFAGEHWGGIDCIYYSCSLITQVYIHCFDCRHWDFPPYLSSFENTQGRAQKLLLKSNFCYRERLQNHSLKFQKLAHQIAIVFSFLCICPSIMSNHHIGFLVFSNSFYYIFTKMGSMTKLMKEWGKGKGIFSYWWILLLIYI